MLHLFPSSSLPPTLYTIPVSHGGTASDRLGVYGAGSDGAVIQLVELTPLPPGILVYFCFLNWNDVEREQRRATTVMPPLIKDSAVEEQLKRHKFFTLTRQLWRGPLHVLKYRNEFTNAGQFSFSELQTDPETRSNGQAV